LHQQAVNTLGSEGGTGGGAGYGGCGPFDGQECRRAAKDSPFGKRIAHGYFVLSAAAGLFVSPAPGPVLANYGLDTLRFVKPVGIGDTIQARLTAKRKIDRKKVDPMGVGQGVVAWDVEVTNQLGELVASYDILTLVAKRT
jgi:oxepin-CoA hydrolase/3-oxo-5,6-dehydrosuberyl-CoA semialdehyde dehydrogenase